MDFNDIFEYLPEGKLLWRINASAGGRAGAMAGSYGRPDPLVRYQGTTYSMARIIWKMHYGEITDGWLVSFLDGNGRNLTLANLCLKTQKMLGASSTRKRSVNNKSGFRGVFHHPAGGWFSQIQRDGVRHYLGRFSAAEAASEAYEAASARLGADPSMT